jgi:hypothetical protein
MSIFPCGKPVEIEIATVAFTTIEIATITL